MFTFIKSSKNRKRRLRRTSAPAGRLADRRKRMAMQRRRTVQAQRFEMVGRAVAFVAGEPVLRVDGVPFFHPRVAMIFREDRSGGDGNAARVALDQGLLLDQDVELHG